MSWFGGGLSNLQGKISSFTAQVLNEVAESVQGDDEQEIPENLEEVAGATEEILQFKKQNEDLILINRELESQLSTLSRQYRNLLSSSKGNHETTTDATIAGQDDHQPQVVESSWQKDVQQWLKSQGLELPPFLKDDRVNSSELNGTECGEDLICRIEAHQAYKNIDQKVAALEEQLVDLDQQHQVALEVAINSRDQLKEENQQLQLQLMQLINDRQQEQQTKSGPLFPIDEESEELDVDQVVETKPTAEDDLKRLENDQQFFRQQIVQFQKQFQSMSDKLIGFELIQSQNDELKKEVATLQENSSKWESDYHTNESRLNEENSDLKAKLEALQNQNQILSSMTSVLDRVTNENRLLESNLESANQTLQVKFDLIEQLKAELLSLQTQQSTTSTLDTVQIEASTDPHLNWLDIQKQIDENCLLQTELNELKALQRSSETNRFEELNNENQILGAQIVEIRQALDSCRIELEEVDASRLKSESDLAKNHDELMLCKSEFERTQEEKHRLESNVHLLNQDLNVHKEEIDHLKTERQSLIEDLEKLRAFEAIKKVEASTDTHSDEPEHQEMTKENLRLQSMLEELYKQHEQEYALLRDANEELKKHLAKNDEILQKSQIQLEETEGRRLNLEAKIGQLEKELETSRKQYDEISDGKARQDEVVSRLQPELEEYRLTLSETRELCKKESIRNEELGQLFDLKSKEAQALLEEIEILRSRHLVLEGEKCNISDMEERMVNLSRETETSREEIIQLGEQLEKMRQERDELNNQVSETKAEKELLRETLQAFQQQREQLVQTVQQKHQEAVSYHAETLRLAKICEELQMRLNEQNELEQETIRLRSETDSFKSTVGQKQAEIERLRSHLLSVEETYTQELLKSQTKERALKESLQAAEERATEQWRLGDQLNVWQDKYRQCLAEKEKSEKDKVRQEKSLDRLQHALQQLTRERERDIVLAQKELAQKLAQAESLQNEKDSEMVMLRRKLSEAQLGLEAAGRLTQQLDKTTAALTTAKDEVRTKEAELVAVRRQMEEVRSGTDSKVDRSLVKNLLIGYFSAPSAKNRLEILRIIATVMDFSSEERRKSGVEESSSGLSGWATGLLKMTARSRTSSGNSSTGDAEKSLSEAFISFMETESARPSPPKLSAQKVDGSPGSTKSNSSMTEFQPGRNEPTILRDVLRDTET
uniref:GRIP domain-containing protein n=1 Tax=Daphnia galeata TaxID=27404 RepID=A0A8J2WQN1_9CRUS|nr:unnamed protein product [Daphnia galeata]